MKIKLQKENSFAGRVFKLRLRIATNSKRIANMTVKLIDMPALNAYIKRIGAEQLNFNRFMVKEFKGKYYVEKFLIDIKDGKLTYKKNGSPVVFDNDTLCASKEEKIEIEAELKEVEFPKPILADDLNLLEQQHGRADYFVFYQRGSGKITMVQERLDTPEGKRYIPWTLWSDGEWRRMEPGGDLPFYKPREKIAARIMVHEGAKAARAAQAIVDDENSTHPWRDTLSEYEHWGMIGGALAPHRADYTEIRSQQPIEVVYVCDNDWPGKSVLQEFSKHYKGTMKGVYFEDKFDYGWDIADPMPDIFYNRSKTRYIGKPMTDYFLGATWATDEFPNPNKKGGKLYVIRKDFKQEWVHCIQPECYINRNWPNRIYSADQFNNLVCPFSDVKDTASVIKRDQTGKGAKLEYSPAMESKIHGNDDGSFLNTHVASKILPEKGDAGPWLMYLKNIFPIEHDRIEMKRWIATLIARPEVKMFYGVLLVSTQQGVGKTTLAERVLAPLVGELNVSYPSENEVVESNYNYWCSHKRLAIINEIYAGSSHKAYNRLKSIITDKTITVSKKYQDHYTIKNWIHVFASSNDMRAIRLAEEDRRWLVPKVSNEKQTTKYWIKFHEWLEEEGGLNIIKWWAKNFLEHHTPVQKGADAPRTEQKAQIIEDMASMGIQVTRNILDEVRAKYSNGEIKPVVFTDGAIVDHIHQKLYQGRDTPHLEKPATVRRIAENSGFYVGNIRVQNGKWNKGYRASRVISNDLHLTYLDTEELEKKGFYPLDINNLMNML